MTSNIARAAEVMLATELKEQGHVVDVDPQRLREYARDLADAGLLAPNLPRADRDGRWWPTAASIGNVTINTAGEIVLHSGRFRDMTLHLTPAKARDLANILNAAADHAEQEKE